MNTNTVRQSIPAMAADTAANLLTIVEAKPDAWDGRERDALALVRTILHDIHEGVR